MNFYDSFVQTLLANKPLLLFLVIALGYFIGRIKIFGFSFGVAAVLFVGLGFGALHPDMVLPDIIYTIGLVLFVYTIGLRSGASFFASFRKSGFRDNLLVMTVLTITAGLTVLLGKIFAIKSTVMAGVFCGALTNTPALASVIEILKTTPLPGSTASPNAMLAEPVVGYSLAYPIGVMGVIFLFQLGLRYWNIDMKKEVKAAADVTGISTEELGHINVQVTNPVLHGKTLREIGAAVPFQHFVASRHLPKGKSEIKTPGADTVVRRDDILTIVTYTSELQAAQDYFGVPTEKDLSVDATSVSMRRIFVSNQDVVGRSLRELNLFAKFQGIVSRIRRGDIEMPVYADMTLEAGDRVRVIAPKDKIQAISKYLGDSYQHLSEVDYISISFGIVLGLLLGMVPIPLPGGTTFRLGFAAGPLIVALVLGKLGRTRNIIWVMSFNANLTLRQMGAVFFLAGIGLKAGYSFFSTFRETGFQMILLGAVITLFAAGTTILVARKVFKMPFNLLMGMLAALHTQPACLAFANEKDTSGAANISYATVYPAAMVMKILLAQMVLGM
jgi:putative transport protein